MELVVEGNEQQAIVRVVGALSASNCQTLREAVLELTTNGRSKILIDIAQMPFIDTSGIGVLIGLKATVTRRGGTFTLVHPQAKVFETLQMMRLDQVLGVKEPSSSGRPSPPPAP